MMKETVDKRLAEALAEINIAEHGLGRNAKAYQLEHYKAANDLLLALVDTLKEKRAIADADLVQSLREHAEWAAANEWETPIMLGDDLTTAADFIELFSKAGDGQVEIRWIPVEEELPKTDDEHRWVHCFVTVSESRWPKSSYDVIDAPESREFVADGMFDCDQKIWHTSEMALNALIPVEDAPVNGYCVTHWMPLPALPNAEC